MISRTKKEIRAAEDKITDLANEAKGIIDAAEAENRQRTPEENEKIADCQKSMGTAKGTLRELEDTLKVEEEMFEASKSVELDSLKGVEIHEPAPEAKSIGDQFVESKGYKGLMDQGLNGKFSSGEIGLDVKGTLTTTPGTALTPPSYEPGIVSKLFPRLTVADIIPTTTTSATVIKFIKESVAENKADTVKEAETKPESKLAFEEALTYVRKIATVLPVSDEMLEDVDQIRGYINNRLSLFVRQTEEAEILRGAGSNPEIQGIIGASGVNTVTVSGTAGTAITESVFNVLNNTRGSSLLTPDTVIMHPNQFAAARLSKDGQGQFYGGGPFTGPYGNGSPATASQFDAFDYWGVRVLVTPAVGAGTALVGAFNEGAQIYRKTGLTVEASNSHANYFVENLTAIRAEERLALALYRPSAFTTVTFS